MRRGVSRWVMPKTVEAKSANSRTAVKCEGLNTGLPPGTQIVRVNRRDDVEEPGNDNETGAPIGDGKLHRVGAEAHGASHDVEQSASEVAEKAENLQDVVPIGVEAALHGEAQCEHADDGDGEQRTAPPFAKKKMSCAGDEPSGDEG